MPHIRIRIKTHIKKPRSKRGGTRGGTRGAKDDESPRNYRKRRNINIYQACPPNTSDITSGKKRKAQEMPAPFIISTN